MENEDLPPFIRVQDHESGFVKSALCILKVNNKSLFYISGHAGPLEVLV